jgi:hypothetical protein
VSGRFFTAVAAYLEAERPPGIRSDRVFMVLKGPRRGQPLSVSGTDEILAEARRRAGLDQATCHELRHTCLTRLREAGMALEAVQAQAGHASIESTRIYLHLACDWPAAQYRKAAEVIDAQVFAASRPGRPRRAGAGGERAAAGQQGGWCAARLGRAGARAPQIAATIRRHLAQIGCVLRPGSVGGADLALRSFAAFLAQTAPGVTSTAQAAAGVGVWLLLVAGRGAGALCQARLSMRTGVDAGQDDPAAGATVRPIQSPAARPVVITGPVMPPWGAGSSPADRSPEGPISHSW